MNHGQVTLDRSMRVHLRLEAVRDGPAFLTPAGTPADLQLTAEVQLGSELLATQHRVPRDFFSQAGGFPFKLALEALFTALSEQLVSQLLDEYIDATQKGRMP